MKPVVQFRSQKLSLSVKTHHSLISCPKGNHVSPHTTTTFHHTNHHHLTITKASDGTPVDAFLDLASLVAAKSTSGHTPYDSLAAKIGDDCYIDVNGWHLYLRDVKLPGTSFSLAQGIAQQLGPELQGQGFKQATVEGMLKKIPVKMGGGKVKISLADSMPSGCVNDMMLCCEDWVRDL